MESKTHSTLANFIFPFQRSKKTERELFSAGPPSARTKLDEDILLFTLYGEIKKISIDALVEPQKSILRGHTFRAESTTGDGNCMYRAIGHFLGKSHVDVRMEMSKNLIQNPEKYKNCKRLTDISTPNTWGATDDIVVAADTFNLY